MSKSRRRVVTPDEQAVLDGFQVRLAVSDADIARCDALVAQYFQTACPFFPEWVPPRHPRAT